jgi:hypothetical protein
LDRIKSIAVPVTRRSTPKKTRRAGHPQFPPDHGIGGSVGEPRRHALPAAAQPRHKYRIGQRLRLVGSGRYWGRTSGLCKVVALMPNEGGALLYRVRSELEQFERVVAEAELVAE